MEAGGENRNGGRKSRPSAPLSRSRISVHPLGATGARGTGTLSPRSTGCCASPCLSFPISRQGNPWVRQDGPVPQIRDPRNPLTPHARLRSPGGDGGEEKDPPRGGAAGVHRGLGFTGGGGGEAGMAAGRKGKDE